MILWLFFSPCPFADVHCSSFPEHVSIGIPSGFLKHSSLDNTALKDTLFEFCSSFGDHLKVFCNFALFLRASCNLIFSSSQVAIQSCFCFLDSLRVSSGQTVSNRVEFWTFWVDRQPMCTLLKDYSTIFGNSVPLGARLRSLHSSNRSACARRRFRCVFLFASKHQRTLMKW